LIRPLTLSAFQDYEYRQGRRVNPPVSKTEQQIREVRRQVLRLRQEQQRRS
jgi:hypothetical protein